MYKRYKGNKNKPKTKLYFPKINKHMPKNNSYLQNIVI